MRGGLRRLALGELSAFGADRAVCHSRGRPVRADVHGPRPRAVLHPLKPAVAAARAASAVPATRRAAVVLWLCRLCKPADIPSATASDSCAHSEPRNLRHENGHGVVL